VIFMVTRHHPAGHRRAASPGGRQGAVGDDVALVVSVMADGKIYLNDTQMDAAALGQDRRDRRRPSPDRLRSRRQGRHYGHNRAVISSLKGAGVDKLGLSPARSG